jgi:hypothetical protein
MRAVLESAVVRIAPSMKAQEVSNTLWAVATLGWHASDRSMRSVIEGAAVRVAPIMSAQHVANTLWALATLGWQVVERSISSALEAAIARVAPIMNPQDVANILWALATLGWQAADESRSALEAAAVRVARIMNAQEVANTLWAAATLGGQATEGPMRCALEAAAVHVARTMNAQNVANTLWALATLGWERSAGSAAVSEHLVEALGCNNGQFQLSTLGLSQLLQAHLASQFLGLKLVTLPSSLLEEAVAAYRKSAREVTVSRGQKAAGESLHRLGILHTLEYITADGLFSIDLAIVDRRIALEFDGPSHFTTNTLEPLGHTILRNRLLSAMGWHVVSIPFFDWQTLHHPEQMDAYVGQRLLRDPPVPHEG